MRKKGAHLPQEKTKKEWLTEKDSRSHQDAVRRSDDEDQKCHATRGKKQKNGACRGSEPGASTPSQQLLASHTPNGVCVP